QHAAVPVLLKDLRRSIESTLGAIRACNSEILPEGGVLPVCLLDLTTDLEVAMLSIRAALLQLDWPGQRSGNVISHCWMFIWQLEKREVSHMDALSLCRLVMKAHGFQDQELEVFSKRSRDAGTVRKRIRENIESALDGT